MATLGSKFTVRLVTNSANTLTFGGVTVEGFTYDAGFNTAADATYSSGGYQSQVNVPGTGGPLGGNSSAGDAGVVCNVKIADNYSLDHQYDAYDVHFYYGASAVPALATTFAALITEAEYALDKCLTDTNANPQGPYALGGGAPASNPVSMGPTGWAPPPPRPFL